METLAEIYRDHHLDKQLRQAKVFTLANFNATEVLRQGQINELESYRSVLPDQYLGIEVEVERVGDIDLFLSKVHSSYIRVTEDGSLRDNGREFILQPHKAMYTPYYLTGLYNTLPSGRSFSGRTSTHIHFNVLDMTPEQIKSVIYIYLAVEGLLYKYIGRDRDKSIFCVPLYQTKLLMNIDSIFNGGKIGSMSWMKYTGLNILPVFKQGTLEFRHLYGCEEPSQILEWLEILLCIFKYAKENDPKLVSEEIVALNTTSQYFNFLEKVFMQYAKLLVCKRFEKTMEKGVAYLKACVFPNSFYASVRVNREKASLGYEKLCKVLQLSGSKRVVDIPMPKFKNNSTPSILPGFEPGYISKTTLSNDAFQKLTKIYGGDIKIATPTEDGDVE